MRLSSSSRISSSRTQALCPAAWRGLLAGVSVLLACGGHGKGNPQKDASAPVTITDGSVQITPEFAECPDLVVTASPRVARVGGQVRVEALASGGRPDAGSTSYHWSASAGAFADASRSATTFTCPGADRAGTAMLTCAVSAGKCTVTRTISVSCLAFQASDASGDSGGGVQLDGGSGDGAGGPDGGQGGSGGDSGTQTCVGDPSLCEGDLCNQCTFGMADGEPDLCADTTDHCANAGSGGNCFAGTDSCAGLASDADRNKCWELYTCLRDGELRDGDGGSGKCARSGDPMPCWCGTNTATCFTDNVPPTQANGPCLQQFFAAAKSTIASYVLANLNNTDLPLGRAFNLAICRSLYCGKVINPTKPSCPLW